MIRPGPSHLEPGLCPGGVIVHVYGTNDGRLLSMALLAPDDDIEAQADWQVQEALAGATENEPMCMVFFDGDSGERIPVPGTKSGDVLRP